MCKYKGYEVYDVYEDPGISAKNTKDKPYEEKEKIDMGVISVKNDNKVRIEKEEDLFTTIPDEVKINN